MDNGKRQNSAKELSIYVTRRNRKSMRVLAAFAFAIFVRSTAFQFPSKPRKAPKANGTSLRLPRSCFVQVNEQNLPTENSEPSSGENQSIDFEKSLKQGQSHHRIGGRRKDIQRKEGRSFSLLDFGGFLDKYRKFIIWTASALLVGVIVAGHLFNFNSPSYVYYQSSVIESRIVGSDGNVQTSRKETFKSNIPDLVREQRKESREGRSISTGARLTDSERALIRSEEQRLSEEMDQFEKSSARIRKELDSSIQADLNLLMDEFF